VILLEPPLTQWECPNCDLTQATRTPPAQIAFHSCAGLAGLNAPMVPAGTGAKVTAREREDYIASEDVQYDGNGRPIMQIVTERPDGSNDVVVLAPTAHNRTS
jgi:hypothetical protein